MTMRFEMNVKRTFSVIHDTEMHEGREDQLAMLHHQIKDKNKSDKKDIFLLSKCRWTFVLKKPYEEN